MTAFQSALYAGKVMHQRLRPRRHRLSYRIFELLLDLDELDALASGLRLFSRNRFNLFSFVDSDHGNRKSASLKAYVESQLEAAVIQTRAYCGAQINRVQRQRVAAATNGLKGNEAEAAKTRAIRALNAEIAQAVANFSGLTQ